MSYGTRKTFNTKKALKEEVERKGAENVGVVGTSLFGDEGADTVADLAGTNAVIVGPDVYSKRTWYATVRIRRDGTIYVA